ncbi:MAG: efflux RND transporter permease subunit [Deltaproteobacteria bacterium]|nr:efflux RND transporter permease subunit [Deltaproteobacteria bacterium]
MGAIVAWCLRFRSLIAVFSVLLIVGGVRAAQQSPLDVFPEFAPLLVEVQTEAPGLSSLDVEQLITVPIEQVVAGIPFLKTLRSKSVQGLSSVVMLFEDSTDLLQARQLVQERIGRVTGLPANARAPVILSPLSSLSRVLKIGLWSDTQSQMEMTDMIRWIVRPRLMAVPGVANVAVWGQRDRTLQVQVDPARLRANGLLIDDVLRATRDATSIGGGGFVDLPSQRIATHQPQAATTALALERTLVVRRNAVGVASAPVPLGSVTTIHEGYGPPIGDGVINGHPGLLLIVEKQPWGNTLEVTQRVEQVLAQLAPQLRGMHVERQIFRPASFVETATHNLTKSLAIGCALVVLVLVFFLRDRRAAMISALAIPLSLAAAMLVLWARHTTLNTLSLAGLTIALGEVVDDAIIDVENIERRLRENALLDTPRSRFDVVLSASLEVRSSVVYATLIVTLVFMPVFFLGGLAGAFFRPLAMTYVLGVLASLVVAVTVTPALSMMLLQSDKQAHSGPTRLAAWIESRYEPLLRRVISHRKLTLAVTLAIAAMAAMSATRLGEGFMPAFRERDFLMHWIAPPGTSLQELRRTVERVSLELRAIPGVRGVGAHLGRAEVADEVVGSNFAELWVSMAPEAPADATRARIEAVINGYPGLQRDVQTYLQERVKEVVSGGKGSIVVRIFGPDLAELQRQAAALADRLRAVPGIDHLTIEQQARVPQLEVHPRLEALANVGLTPNDVRTLTSTLQQGQRVGQVYREGRVVDVLVIGEERFRRDLTALNAVPVDPAGTPLGSVADLHMGSTPNAILHEGTLRRIDLSCDAKGRDLGAVARETAAVVQSHPFAPEYRAEVLGEFAARAEASQRLWGFSLLAFLAIFLVLYVDFRSVRAAGVVFASLPFALAGGVAGAFAGGGILSLGSLVGFVSVLGITARNGIMLVSHYRHLELVEGIPLGPELLIRGTRERLIPILMTALATGLGLAPIALAGGQPGHEIEHPMALVIMGGLLSSTVLNLIAMPALYGLLSKPMDTRATDDPAQ